MGMKVYGRSPFPVFWTRSLPRSDSGHVRYAEGSVRYSIHTIPYNVLGSAKYMYAEVYKSKKYSTRADSIDAKTEKVGSMGILNAHSTRNPISIYSKKVGLMGMSHSLHTKSHLYVPHLYLPLIHLHSTR